jgi:hypothetical protein
MGGHAVSSSTLAWIILAVSLLAVAVAFGLVRTFRSISRHPEWPRWATWPVLSIKWGLVALGLYASVGLAAVELKERRAGLGLGISTALTLATVKGVFGAIAKLRDDS